MKNKNCINIARWLKAGNELLDLYTLKPKPLISIIMATFNTPEKFLIETLNSILSQTYEAWEACIVDDGSSTSRVGKILQSYALKDSRIKYKLNQKNSGISSATNQAISLSSGTYLGFLDHDDELMPNALELCMKNIILNNCDAVYTDQETVDSDGKRLHTFHKPKFSKEYLKHVMYIGHFLIVKKEISTKIGGFKSEFDGVQDYEFFLRLAENTNKIVHVPKVLYKWKAIEGSLASATDAKKGIANLQAKAVQDHLDRTAITAIAIPNQNYSHRCKIIPNLQKYPKVSIVIPTKDQPKLIAQCLSSIFEKTTYPKFEVIIVDTGTTDADALNTLNSYPVNIVKYTEEFNFSAACNLGVNSSSGDILIFLNNDTEVISNNWVESIVHHFSENDVGVVGGLLLYPDKTVQHAGVVLGARGTADHVMRGFPADSDGYAGSLSCPREVSAITGACLGIKRTTFDIVSGFNEFYGTHYQDVDLCLKVRKLNLRCIFTPEAKLFHHESPSRGSKYDFLDRLLFIDSWRRDIVLGDPYYSSSFSLSSLDYSLNN